LRGEVIVRNVRKVLVVLGVYLLFASFLVIASERIERLDQDGSFENVGVAIKFGE